MRKKRLLSLLLCVTVLFYLCYPSALAEDSARTIGVSNLCEHHPEHDADCGYSEGTVETPCGHEHTEDCYTEVTECVHEHDEDCYPDAEDSISSNDDTPSNTEEWEPENCSHICDEDSGCVTKELDCQHEHDGECGYVPATEGTPCEYVCEICGGETGEREDQKTEAECICTIACTTEAVNEECPVCAARRTLSFLCVRESRKW